MKPMLANKMRHWITIQQNAATARDGHGEREMTWQAFASMWSEVSPLSPRDVPMARSFKAETNHRIRIRYRPGVLPTMRVVFGTRGFSIDGITNTEERNYELVLYCTEIVPAPKDLK